MCSVLNVHRQATIHAVRDTEIVVISSGLFDVIQQMYPMVIRHVIRSVGQRSQQQQNAGITEANVNLSTVAVIAVNEQVPLSQFTIELESALAEIGPTLRLNRQVVSRQSGMSADSSVDSSGVCELTDWLSSQEDSYDIVLYEADFSNTPWTQRCIRQADIILVVGLGYQRPSVSPIEEEFTKLAGRAQKELVLLHPMSTKAPKGTADWLNMRDWCSRHHHIRCSPTFLTQLRTSEVWISTFLFLFLYFF